MRAQHIVVFWGAVPQGGFRWLDASAIAAATPQRWRMEAIPVG